MCVGFVLSFFACLFVIEPALAVVGIWKVLGMVLGSTLLVASLSGISLGSLHDVFSKPRSDTFILTRPISTASVIGSKMITAAISTVASWLLVPICLSLLLLRPELCEPIADRAHSVPFWKAVGLPLLAAALLGALTWKNIIENLWMGLTGRDWVAQANVFGGAAVFFGAIGLGSWVYFHPELQPGAWAALPWIVGLLILCKLLVAACVLRSLGSIAAHRQVNRGDDDRRVELDCRRTLSGRLLAHSGPALVSRRHARRRGALRAIFPARRCSLVLEWNRHR